MTKKLHKLIDDFLAVRSKSKGGYAPVSEWDVKALPDIVQALVEAKYERDPDGDLPVQVILVDRTKYQSMHFAAVPHLHKTNQALQDYDRQLEVVAMNLAIASQQMDVAQRLFHNYVHELPVEVRAVTVRDLYGERNSDVD